MKLAGRHKCRVLVVRTDGGPDRNNLFIKVQLAYLALALELDLVCIILMRTTPGQSYVSPVERVMRVLSYALSGMGLARGHTNDETEAVLKDCSTMKQCRIALKNVDEGSFGDNSKAFAASMQVPIEQVSSALKEMTWNDRQLKVFDAASSDARQSLLNHLTSIEPTTTSRILKSTSCVRSPRCKRH